MRPLRTLILAAYRLTVLVAAVGLTVLNVRLYHGPTSAYARPALGPDVVAQLESLRERLDDGAGDDAQALFPEGYFFLHVLYGLSWVEVGLRETSGGPAWARALSEARWANARLASADGRAPFAPELQPAYGVFYTGWRAWLGGGIQLLQPAEMRPADEREAYEAEVAELAAAFAASPTPFLESYPGQAWPVDSVVAAAALRLHETVAGPAYRSVLARWNEQVAAVIAEHDGLLPHRTRPSTTFALEGPRGTSQSLSARFLIEIDPALGGDFYTAYRARFVRPFLGVPGVVEWAGGPAEFGGGDVDSGPLVAGFSASATVVALAAAQVVGDVAVSDSLLGATEAVGLPVTWDRRKAYALGALPIGDAFIVWAKTSSRWMPGPSVPLDLPGLAQPFWRWPFHVATLGLLLGLAAPEFVRRARSWPRPSTRPTSL